MENWQAWGISVAVTVIVAAFLRVAKKRQWASKLNLVGVNVGKAFSVMLMRWLPPAAAEKAEEGIIVTALALISEFIRGFETGILSDNIHRLKKGEEK